MSVRMKKERGYTLMPHPNALSLASLEGTDFYCKINLMKNQFTIQYPLWCSS